MAQLEEEETHMRTEPKFKHALIILLALGLALAAIAINPGQARLRRRWMANRPTW